MLVLKLINLVDFSNGKTLINLLLRLRPSWSWSYGSWIYNYLCNQCILQLKLWVWIPFMARRTHTTKFVSDLRHVGDFPQILRFPPPIKLTATT